jgi:hypothetical protein
MLTVHFMYGFGQFCTQHLAEQHWHSSVAHWRAEPRWHAGGAAAQFLQFTAQIASATVTGCRRTAVPRSKPFSGRCCRWRAGGAAPAKSGVKKGPKPRHGRRLEVMPAPLPSPEVVSSCNCIVMSAAGSIVDTLTDAEWMQEACPTAVMPQAEGRPLTAAAVTAGAARQWQQQTWRQQLRRQEHCR